MYCKHYLGSTGYIYTLPIKTSDYTKSTLFPATLLVDRNWRITKERHQGPITGNPASAAGREADFPTTNTNTNTTLTSNQ